MSARVMLTVSRVLPDDRAAVETNNLRFLLEKAGWNVLDEACDPLGDEAPASTAQESSTAQLNFPVVRCTHCHGVGRAAGIDCGVCRSTGKITA